MTDTVDLPPLPEPAGHVVNDMYEWRVSDDTKEMELERGCDVFTADQMRAYGAECARQAVERCARIADAAYVDSDSERGIVASEIAAAIRKGG